MTGTGDHLLDQFQALPGSVDFYRIGHHAPISLRDQLVRAGYLVQRLWTVGRLRPHTRLLIVGAGASGVATTIAAIRAGVRHVTLVDPSDGPLSLQANCRSRWIDPAQYDWPAPHWAGELWPLQEQPAAHATCSLIRTPVTLTAKTAELLAVDFKNELAPYEANGSAITYYNHRFLAAPPNAAGHYDALIEPTSGASSFQLPADVIVFAGGMGRERVTLNRVNGGPSYSSTHFWENDDLEDPAALQRSYHPVVVTGSGDGALQDFIRLFTGQPSARAVWIHVLNAVPSSSPALQAIHALWHWEDHARRIETFAPDVQHRTVSARQVHSRYQDAVAQLFREHGTEARNALSALIRTRDFGKVRLMLKDNCFEGCYPLNRLVALILILYAVIERKTHPVLNNRAILDVEDVGTDVLARYATPTYGWTTPAELASWTGTDGTELFGAIVVRHGIDTTTTTWPVDRLLQQTLPLHFV